MRYYGPEVLGRAAESMATPACRPSQLGAAQYGMTPEAEADTDQPPEGKERAAGSAADEATGAANIAAAFGGGTTMSDTQIARIADSD